jgi:hypothetical protein
MWIWDPGWKKVGSGMRDNHPGSATLTVKTTKLPDQQQELFPERESLEEILLDFPVDAPATRTLLEALCRNFLALSSFHFCRLNTSNRNKLALFVIFLYKLCQFLQRVTVKAVLWIRIQILLFSWFRIRILFRILRRLNT